MGEAWNPNLAPEKSSGIVDESKFTSWAKALAKNYLTENL
jgi:hypothetical protein